jgi:hypothetical protein
VLEMFEMSVLADVASLEATSGEEEGTGSIERGEAKL